MLARALARDAEQVQELTTIVLHASDHPDELRARTVVTAIGTAVRLAYDEWARRAERGETVPVRSLYLQVRSGLVDYFTGGGAGQGMSIGSRRDGGRASAASATRALTPSGRQAQSSRCSATISSVIA